MNTALALVGAAHFASLMLLFGAECVQRLFHVRLASPPELRAPAPAWLASVALATAALWLFLSAIGLSPESFDVASVWTVVRGTEFGRVSLARLVLLLLLLGASFRPRAQGWRIALAGAALAALALTSHAAASGCQRLMPFRAANDALHLLAAGFWIGGLSVLVPLAAAQRKAPAMLVAPLQLFSGWGMAAVALLIAAGTVNASVILFGANARWSPAYLGLLAAKLVLAAVMISLALTNRLALLPGLRHRDSELPDDLLISTTAELAAGIAIVVIVGFLGTLSPWSM